MNRQVPARRSAVLLAILALAALPTSALAPPDQDGSDLAAYADKLLTETYPAGEPGAAALIVKDGKPVLRKGYGLANLELGVPIQPDTVFEIGSVTKQFTAAAILMLAERGLVSADDEITKHLPDYPTHGKRITVEHLLTHTSGIPSYTAIPEWRVKAREDVKVQQIIDVFKDRPLEFEPGERFAYNNSAYILLGALVEKLSGRTYEDFVEQEIFKPLGMTRSRYGHKHEIVPGRAEGYGKTGEGYRKAPYISMTHPYAAGSLMATVDDLARWTDALWNGRLLKPESLQQMFTPVKLSSGLSTEYGYGWSVQKDSGRTFIEHGGDIFGFSAQVLFVPEERLFVAVVTNNPAKQPNPDALAFRIASKALGSPIEDRPVAKLDSRTLDEYVGVYRFPGGVVRTITREGDKLFAQRSGSDKLEVLPLAKDELFYADTDGRLRFRRDAQGKIVGVDLNPRFGPDDAGERTHEPLPSERQAVQVDPALFDAYAGVYELAPGFELTITREGSQIFAQATDQPRLEIFPESETKFFFRVVDARIVFVPGDGAKASSLVVHQGGKERPGKRVK